MATDVRPYHHGDLRNALLAAATEQARVSGTEGVVLREAARRVGVSASAAYRHFPSREALIAAVGSRARELLATRMLAAMAAVPADAGDAADVARLRFRATGVTYIEFALEEPGLFEIGFHPCPPDLVPPEDPSPYEVLSRALDAVVAAGGMAPERRAGAEEPAWAAVHGAAVLLRDGAIPRTESRRVIDGIVDLVGLGLGAAPQPSVRSS